MTWLMKDDVKHSALASSQRSAMARVGPTARREKPTAARW
jgi:hypothetical protein